MHFFLDVKKAYDTVWRDGLWYKMWEMGIKGKMWRAVRPLYTCMLITGAVFWKVGLLNFPKYAVGCSGCTVSPTLFSVNMNELCEIEKCLQLGVKVSENTFPSLLFANDFVGVAEAASLQIMIEIVHNSSKL